MTVTSDQGAAPDAAAAPHLDPATGTGTNGLRLEDAWRATVATPLSSEVVAQLQQLAGATEALMLADITPIDKVLERATALGRYMATIDPPPPEAVAPALAALARMAGPIPPERLGLILAGVAEGLIDAARNAQAGSRSALARQSERLQLLRSTLMGILAAESLGDILDMSARFVDSVIPSLSTTIVTYDFTAGEYIVESSTQPAFAVGTRRPITLWGMIDRLRQGQAYYVPDVQARPGFLPGLNTVTQVGGRSFLAVPMLYRGDLIGAFTMATERVYDFQADELDIVGEIATVVAVAVQYTRTLQAEQQARENEATLRDVAASLTLGLDLDEILGRILHQLERVVACHSATIVLLEEGKPVLAAQRGLHNTADELDALLLASPESLAWVLNTGQPRVINDTGQFEHWKVLPGLEFIRAWMGVPLLVKGVCIGALTLDRTRPNSFTPQEYELVMAFAHQAAIAIENARLFGEAQTYAIQLEARVRERTRELEALYGITAATVEDPDLDSVLRRALELTLQAFRCTAGAIYLSAGGERSMHPAAYLDRSEGELSRLLVEPSAAGGLLSRLAPDGAPWIVDGDLPAMLFGDLTQALAVAPLRAREGSLGVLVLLSEVSGCFSNASLLLTTIADQIGAAVENFELRQKARQAAILAERDRLARELHDAVTQSIYGISYFAEAARESARAGEQAQVERHLQSILQTSQRALGELRLLLYDLRSETLAQHGLAGALVERLQSVEQRAQIETELLVEGVTTLPVALEEAFYRVAQEALNNSMRHSRARRVEVTLVAHHGELNLTVRDNGTGFRLRDAVGRGGMGLDIMEQRMQQLGGHLKVTSRPGRGTRVEARAPLAQPVGDPRPTGDLAFRGGTTHDDSHSHSDR